ncbi:hypothetical protein GWK47_017444 [Chionoecetes opilio]|uniref:Reverse transcriptase domain-containing protein n=1 Tax=Chionoecetes opilio TaxID=41210 RepID=A0A8J5CJ31_CHIOP|nr:hypothetical protein GWK47_017444 [Chionoecetes opilio]
MAITPLAYQCFKRRFHMKKTQVKQVAYADDLTGAGKITDLKKWWALVKENGLTIGYTPNATKSILIVKPEHYENGLRLFSDSGVIVTKDGQRHLGAVIGTEDFKAKYVGEKVSEWVKEVGALSGMAKTEPHAAYSAFTHGLQHRWSFVKRTIPGISLLLRPLEESIRKTFLPALLKSNIIIGDNVRELLTFPPKLGGMGITSPEKLADEKNRNFINLTSSLTEKIIAQDANGETDQNAILELKKTISRDRQSAQVESLERLKGALLDDTVRKIHTAHKTGASNWLTCLPIRAKGFSLNKQEFVDAVALRYGWPVEGIPKTCVCGVPNNVDHTITCKRGGFVCIRHDEVRDVTASMLREVCRDVSTEPTLLPIDGEQLQYRTANTANEARPEWT